MVRTICPSSRLSCTSKFEYFSRIVERGVCFCFTEGRRVEKASSNCIRVESWHQDFVVKQAMASFVNVSFGVS